MSKAVLVQLLDDTTPLSSNRLERFLVRHLFQRRANIDVKRGSLNPLHHKNRIGRSPHSNALCVILEVSYGRELMRVEICVDRNIPFLTVAKKLPKTLYGTISGTRQTNFE